MKPKSLKILAIVVLVIMLLNLLLFALTKIGGGVFWGVIVAGAIFSYLVLPRLKNN